MTLKTRGRGISANRYHADSMMTSRPRIPLCLLVAMLMCIPACSQRHEAAFGGLEQGMTRDQVRDLLGPPSTTYYATEDLRVEAGGGLHTTSDGNGPFDDVETRVDEIAELLLRSQSIKS